MGEEDTSTATDDADDTTGTDDAGASEAEKWKRLARKHEGRAKAAQAEIEKLKAGATSASESDMDKLRSTVEELRSDLAEERRKAMVAEIAAERGLTPAQAKRLTGSTREEIEEDADEIVEAFGIKPDKGSKSGSKAGDGDGSNGSDDDGQGDDGDTAGRGKSRPKEKLRGGASSESDTDGRSGEELADEVLKRTRGGF